MPPPAHSTHLMASSHTVLNAPPAGPAPGAIALAGALLVCGLLALHLLLRGPHYPFMPDSASYIQLARSLADLAPAGAPVPAYQPSPLFPIGFPALLSVFAHAGLDPREAAPLLGSLSSLLLPPLIVQAFRHALGSTTAVAIAFIATLSPGLLWLAGYGLTDLPACALSLAAAGCLLSGRSAGHYVAAGLLAGAGYALRNAQLALIAALGLLMLYRMLTHSGGFGPALRGAALFAAGAALPLTPVLFYNFWTFGSLHPYSMGPSTVGVLDNLRTYVQEFIYDASGFRDAGVRLAWTVPGLLACLLAAAAYVRTLIRAWSGMSPAGRELWVLTAGYAVAGAAIVIAARSRYEWGEFISTRHTLQILPFALAAWLVVPLRTPVGRRLRTLALLLLCASHTVFALRLDPQLELQQARGQTAREVIAAGRPLLCPPHDGAQRLSNWAYLFEIECAAPIRQFSLKALGTHEATFGQLVTSLRSAAAATPAGGALLAMYPGRAWVSADNLRFSAEELDAIRATGWTVRQADGHAFIAHRD